MKSWLSPLLYLIRCFGAYIPIFVLPNGYWCLKIISLVCVISFIQEIDKLNGERDFWKQTVIIYQKERYKMYLKKEQNNDEK